jgi:hypothetical protein
MNAKDNANVGMTNESETRLFQLQQEIYDGLRVQHPDWIEANGDRPACESYESRSAELLGLSSQKNPCQADSLSESLNAPSLSAGRDAASLTAKLVCYAYSLERGSVEQLFGGIAKSHTRALVGTESSSRFESMKASHSLDQLLPQEASSPSTISIPHTPWHIRRRDSLPLREALPLWFAISSPLIGLILGFLGAWFVTWLTS